MNTVKNYATIHLRLKQIDVLKFVILLIKYVFQTKTEDLNLSVFNMVTGINDLKTLTRHISCKYKCRFDGRKCNSGQKWYNDKC